jgi:PAS domain S-box-containing protein
VIHVAVARSRAGAAPAGGPGHEPGERRFRSLVEAAPDGIVMVDAEGRIELVNPQAELMFGYRAEELIGRPLEVLVPERFRRVHVAHRASFAGRPRLRPMGADLDLYALRRDGSEFPVEIRLAPVRSDDGELRVMSLISDMTEARQREERLRAYTKRLEAMTGELELRVQARTAALREANEELESFSYSVSHDLRAPLRAIDGFAGLLAEEAGFALKEEHRRYLDLIRANADAMGRLIDGLLALSRLGRQALSLQRVELASLAREAAAEVVEAAGSAVPIEIGALPAVHADRVLLRQVLVNLLSNAVKFSTGREGALVEVGVVEADGESPAVYFVRDNGVGFDMLHADGLFDAFGRLHGAEEYEGAGIGLALAARVVRQHGGRIWAEATPGKGATFFFTLHEAEA